MLQCFLFTYLFIVMILELLEAESLCGYITKPQWYFWRGVILFNYCSWQAGYFSYCLCWNDMQHVVCPGFTYKYPLDFNHAVMHLSGLSFIHFIQLHRWKGQEPRSTSRGLHKHAAAPMNSLVTSTKWNVNKSKHLRITRRWTWNISNITGLLWQK